MKSHSQHTVCIFSTSLCQALLKNTNTFTQSHCFFAEHILLGVFALFKKNILALGVHFLLPQPALIPKLEIN